MDSRGLFWVLSEEKHIENMERNKGESREISIYLHTNKPWEIVRKTS